VHLDERRVARCGPGEPLPVGQALTVGQTVDLNHVSAAELALIPGISGELARRLVDERARRGGFRSWNEVDEIEGVGLARLDRLQQHCRLQMTDSGV
jgi:competence protein ComEA